MARQVHRIRFYSLETNSIKCMSLEKTFKLLALSREDNSIEIWNVSQTPHIQITIFTTFGTIEGLAWYQRRLFSVGLQGSIIEYDLRKQEPKSMHPISSSACWCLSIHESKKQLAAGTEDGYINIFDIYDQELIYNKVMDKQEGRIYCISWHPNGEYLITGSVETVRVWKVSTGHAIHRMLTGREANRKETIVWNLVVTDDFTIIAGDSRGKLCFWDGSTGVSITTYQSHKADILSVCLGDDQNVVYCAGVDPLIASYERVKMHGSEEQVKWVRSIQRAIHDHDVRCLIASGNKLFSAGIDGYLALSSYPPKLLIKYPPLLQPPCAVLAPESKLILLRYPTCIIFWQLNIDKNPVKVLEWRPPAGLRIRAAGISKNGKWFACSMQDRFCLYSMKLVDCKPELTKIKTRIKKCSSSCCIEFSGDSRTMVLATLDGHICAINMETETPSLKYVLRPNKDGYLPDNLSKIAVSEKGSYIIATDISSNIAVWCEGKFYCKLPVYKRPVTAIAIQPGTNYLILVYSDHQILEYSLDGRKYTEFSRQLQTHYPKEWLIRNFAVHSIVFDDKNPDLIILTDDTTILVINKQKELLVDCNKIPRLTANHNIPSPTPKDESDIGSPCNQLDSAFHIIKRYKHLAFFGKFINDEMVVVEVSPAKFKEKLPLTSRKLFGRM